MKGLTALVINPLNGLSVVQQLVKQGCNVIVNGLGEERSEEAVRLSANLQKEIEVHNLVEQIWERFRTIDIVIFNNYGQRDYRAAIDEYPLEHWREIIDRNLISTFSLIKTVWPQMKRQYFGRIIHLVCVEEVLHNQTIVHFCRQMNMVSSVVNINLHLSLHTTL